MKMRAFVVVLLAFLISGIFPQGLIAADKKEKEKKKKAWVAGKIYDVDQKTPLEDVPIRIVRVEDGKDKNEESEEEGCYWFEDVEKGTYSMSVNYGGKDYLLPDKFFVENLYDHEVAVSVCIALNDKDQSLTLLKDCHICLGGGFPPLGILLLSVAGPIIPGLPIGGGQDEVVSESRPEDGRP